MAFNRNGNNNSAPAAANTTNDDWKAQGFINFYLPAKDGSRRKLGAIPLKESKPQEKILLDWLEADPKNVEALLAKLIVEYRPAEAPESSGFDLG